MKQSDDLLCARDDVPLAKRNETPLRSLSSVPYEIDPQLIRTRTLETVKTHEMGKGEAIV